MIKSVVREHHWTPETINGLFLDEVDHFGLEYWYKDVVKVNKQLEQKYKKK